MMRENPSSRASQIPGMTRLMIGTLLLQFVLGMYTNLFVTLPQVPEPSGPSGFMSHMGPMMSVGARHPVFLAHMIVGMLLALGAVVTLVGALSSHQRHAIILTSIGLASVLIAGYGGLTFFMGGQHNSASFTMALGWLVALTTYFIVWRVSTS